MIASIFALTLSPSGSHAKMPGACAADVAGAHEQPVARDLGVGRVFAERAEEEVRETGDHEGQV